MVVIDIVAPLPKSQQTHPNSYLFSPVFCRSGPQEAHQVLTAVQNFPIMQNGPLRLVMAIISDWQTANINPEQGGQIATPKPKS